MDIDTMPAGPEMDRMVAERVMGWNASMRQWDGWNYYDDNYPNADSRIWAPSRDIAHAWEVVELMHHRGVKVMFIEDCDIWAANIGYQMMNSLGHTAPLAICRAALMAVGE